jgi:hypothetical protein
MYTCFYIHSVIGRILEILYVPIFQHMVHVQFDIRISLTNVSRPCLGSHSSQLYCYCSLFR